MDMPTSSHSLLLPSPLGQLPLVQRFADVILVLSSSTANNPPPRQYPQFTPPNGFIPKPIVSKWQTKFVDYFTDKPRGRPITTDEPLNLYTVITPEEAKRLASARYQRILRARQRSKEEAKQAANKKVIDEGNAHIVSTLKRIAEMQAVIKKKKFELAKARARYAELRERAKDVPGSEWIAKVEEDEDVYPGPQQGDYQLFYDTIVNRGFRRN